MLSYLLKYIVLDTLYFPLWWYTRGFKKVLLWAGNSLQEAERSAALKIWFKAMFQPMFQDYTRSGRIISFFMRLILLIFKLVGIGLWATVLLAMITLWLALPVGTIWLIIKSYSN